MSTLLHFWKGVKSNFLHTTQSTADKFTEIDFISSNTYCSEPREEGKSDKVLQTHKHKNTLVCEDMHILSHSFHPGEDVFSMLIQILLH